MGQKGLPTGSTTMPGDRAAACRGQGCGTGGPVAGWGLSVEKRNKEGRGGGRAWNLTAQVPIQALLFHVTRDKSLYLPELQIPNS